MNVTPSRPSNNRFACLPVDEIDESPPFISETVKVVPPSPTSNLPTLPSSPEPPAPPAPALPPSDPKPRRKRVQKWRRRLPKEFILALKPEPRSIDIPVELQSATTQRVVGTQALVDCGATNFGYLDRDFARRNGLPTTQLPSAIPVFNVDGTRNEAGSISEMVDVILTYREHSERIQLGVTQLGSQSLILGHGWLRLHNPEIDWESGEVKLSRCPEQCSTCRKEEVRLMADRM